MEALDRRVRFELGHDVLGSLLGPDVSCSTVGADGKRVDIILPAAIAHSLWAIPDLCGVELFSLTIHHGSYFDDWGQSV